MTIINKKCWEPNFKKTNSCTVLPSPKPITIIPPKPLLCGDINTTQICPDDTKWFCNNQVLGRLGPPPEGYSGILLYTKTNHNDDFVELLSSTNSPYNGITFLRVRTAIYLTFNVDAESYIVLNFLNDGKIGSQDPYLSANSGLLLGNNLQFATTTKQQMNVSPSVSYFNVGKSNPGAFYKVDPGIYTFSAVIFSDTQSKGISIVSSVNNEDPKYPAITMGLSYTLASCE